MRQQLVNQSKILGLFYRLIGIWIVVFPQSILSAKNWEGWKSLQDSFSNLYITGIGREPEISAMDQGILEQVSPLILNNPALALEILEQHLQKSQSSALYFVTGNLCLQLDQLSKSEKYLIKSVEGFPDFMRAHKNLGIVSLQLADYESAMTSLTKAISLGARDKLVFSALGFCYLQIGHYASAENAYRQALLEDAKSVDVRNGLITALMHQNREEEALGFIDEVILSFPANYSYWTSRASAQNSLGNIDDAIISYEFLNRMGLAVALDLVRIGDAYLSIGIPRIAYTMYNRALSHQGGVEPKYAFRSIYQLADLGHFEEALSLLSKVDQEYGKYLSDEEKITVNIARANALISKGDKVNAKISLGNVLKLDPLNADALLILGKLLLESDLATAIMLLERAAKIDTVADQANIELARIYAEQRDWKKSLLLLSSIREPEKYKGLKSFIMMLERLRGY
jgi:tetratricopeptide (TPR) repeat protein